MNQSLRSADPTTHLKVVCLSLIVSIIAIVAALCRSRHFDVRRMEHAMTKLLQAYEALPFIPAGLGPARTRARHFSETASSFLQRMLSARNAVPTLMEWDNDVPPIPIFAGEWRAPKRACRRRRGDINTALLLDR